MSEQIASAITWGAARCADFSDSPKLDVELLLAYCLKKPRSYLYSWPDQAIPPIVWQRYQELVNNRIKPTPVAYLVGRREFFSLNFSTTTIALVPRPESELLVEACLDLCAGKNEIILLELGTGTGAIAISLKVNRPDISMVATDISIDCLDLAQNNAADHDADIEWIESDWFSVIDNTRQFDFILSNPPYIAASDPCLKQGDLRAEPLAALSPGKSGLEALQQIIVSAPSYLKPRGHLLLEHGFDQQSDVGHMMQAQGFTGIICQTDLNGLPRLSIGRLAGTPGQS